MDEPMELDLPADAVPDDGEPPASDEGEGDAVNPLSDDSSEEAPTDEEEAVVVRKGFIVDDDEDEDAEEDEEEKRRQRKRRRRIRRRSESLDADDLELMEENTGTRVNRSRNQHLSRIRRGRAATSQSPPPRPAAHIRDDVSENDSLPDNDIANIFEDRVRSGRGEVGEDLDMEDDDDNFIDDDDEDLDGEMGDEEREERRRIKRRDEKSRKMAKGARPQMAGIDQAEWDEIYDVFGIGTEYAWALDDDELSDNEEAPKEMRYEDVFEPSEIAARFLTAEDDVIRANDIPERMQLTTSSLSSAATLASHLTYGAFPDEEIDAAAEWVSVRLSTRVQREFFVPEGKYHKYIANLVLAVRATLKYLLQDRLEVPYIWTHRRDHLSVFEPTQLTTRIELLSREELWRVGILGARYRALHARTETLSSTYARMNISDDYFEVDVLRTLDSADTVADAMEWLAMRHKQAHQDALALDDGEGVSEATQRRKKPSRVSPYDVAKSTNIALLADSFGIAPYDVVRNIILNQKGHPTEDHDLAPLQLAEEFVSGLAGATSPEEALRTARLIIATELGRDPQLRKLARDKFKSSALISIQPTEKGTTKIDEQHPYAGFKYLLNKPVESFLQDAQFLHILAAENELLITVTITMAPGDIKSLQDQLQRAYKSDGYSDVSAAWNVQRTAVIDEVIEKHLFPAGIKFVREWLREEVEETLANRCADILERLIEVAPYRPEGMDKNDVPSVLAVSFGKGDANKDPVVAVVLDDVGRLREHVRFDNLIDSAQRSEFLALVKRRKPDVIVVGSFTIFGLKLMERVKEVLGYTTPNGDAPAPVPAPAADVWGSDDTPAAAATDEKDRIPVIWVPDQVARIYQHSKRAETEFGSLPLIGRYCVGLARYTQSPVNEYAALGPDLVAITFHDDQQLLSPDALLTALERTIVNVVNEVGVDINRAMTDSYYSLLLPFIAGLGPRKAQAMIKRIAANGGTVLNREQFIMNGIMTTQIFINASGFLRIVQDPYEDSRSRRPEPGRAQDPLDATRIHPEDYDLARKMATDALELDDEDVANQHPSAVITQLMQDEDNVKKLDDLSLDDFALNLQETTNDRKRHTLDMIRDELLNPFGEMRAEFSQMTDWEIITMLTGETRLTLHPGRVLTVSVSRVRAKEVEVKLDSGLEGWILREHLTTENSEPSSVVKPRQSIQAVILSIHLLPGANLRVQLASRPDAIAQADAEVRGLKHDAHYDQGAARHALELQQRKQRSEASRSRRVVKHPAFKNMNSKEAESYLAPLQHGDAVIRPSSKGSDHLAVTWKVADGVFQHIDVVEPNADGNQTQAGSQFIIEGKYFYVDLDDLLVNHVKAMSRKADDLMAHDKYKGDSNEELQNFLMNFVKMNPTRSSYAFGLNRQKPGFFNLSFLANVNSPVQTWLVKVTPTAYRLAEVEVGSVPDLCDAFKRKHQKDLRAMNGSKTPYAAGRTTPGRVTGGTTPARLPGGITPGRLPGGVTPGYGTSYGKTPNPYGAQPFPPPAPFPNQQPVYASSMPSAPPAPIPPMTPNPGVGMINPERLRMIQQGGGGGGYGQTPR